MSNSHMYIYYPLPLEGIRFGVEAEYGNGFVRQACSRPSVGGGFVFVPELLLPAPLDWRESDGVELILTGGG